MNMKSFLTSIFLLISSTVFAQAQYPMLGHDCVERANNKICVEKIGAEYQFTDKYEQTIKYTDCTKDSKKSIGPNLYFNCKAYYKSLATDWQGWNYVAFRHIKSDDGGVYLLVSGEFRDKY